MERIRNNVKQASLVVRYYRYPNQEIPWRKVVKYGSLHDTASTMMDCLKSLSGNKEFYCEGVLFMNGKRMPGISNKREGNFMDGRLHWKQV